MAGVHDAKQVTTGYTGGYIRLNTPENQG